VRWAACLGGSPPSRRRHELRRRSAGHEKDGDGDPRRSFGVEVPLDRSPDFLGEEERRVADDAVERVLTQACGDDFSVAGAVDARQERVRRQPRAGRTLRATSSCRCLHIRSPARCRPTRCDIRRAAPSVPRCDRRASDPPGQYRLCERRAGTPRPLNARDALADIEGHDPCCASYRHRASGWPAEEFLVGLDRYRVDVACQPSTGHETAHTGR
jgi:hypothetical protein